MTRGRVVLAVSTICFGCAAPHRTKPPEPASQVGAPALGSAAPPSQALANASAPPARLPIEFVPVERAATPGAIPQLEVQAPLTGARIPLADAAKYEIRLKASSWSDGFSVVMLLDDYPPRVFKDPRKPIALAELWPTHRELEPGLHRLFVALQLPDGTTLERGTAEAPVPFVYRPFWVGAEPGASPASEVPGATEPEVILLTPRGTFNGNTAADQVLLDYRVLGLPSGAAPPKVRAEVIVDRQAYVAELGVSDVRRIVGLPSGDHTVRVTLLGVDGQPSSARHASASRVITVNRDAPVE